MSEFVLHIFVVIHNSRAVARFENPGGLVVLWWAQSALLVKIGLTVWPKTGGAEVPPPAPRLRQPCIRQAVVDAGGKLPSIFRG